MLKYLEHTDSTNTQLTDFCNQQLAAGNAIENLTTIYTFSQSAGRGQQGNKWESEPGQNLLFSTAFLLPQLPAQQQFRITELVALAVWETVSDILRRDAPQISDSLKIKWPNDLYAADRKLAGMLIENCLAGSHILYSVAGIGLNVNQTAFTRNVPNPVSLSLLTGQRYDLHELMQQILTAFARLLPLIEQGGFQTLHSMYMQHLYRRQGWFEWEERECSTAPSDPLFAHESNSSQKAECSNSSQNANGSGGAQNANGSGGAGNIIQPDSKRFEAQIEGVDEQGRLLLTDRSGGRRCYHFKQIRYVI